MGDDRLKEQLDYYRARAGEYDAWFLREGRYDRGPLELACGTGLWTQRLARQHARVVAIDGSPETIDLRGQSARSVIHRSRPRKS